VEASTGIEPVYTDLQAPTFFKETNAKGHFQYQDICRTKGEHDTQKKSTFSRYMKPAHQRMSRMLGYCLTLGTPEAWSGFSLVAAVRLDVTERAALGFAALNALDTKQARMTAAASLGAACGPLPPFLGGMEDATQWAEWAGPAELDAYCLAAFRRMAPARQAAFLRFVQRRAVA